MAEMEVFVPGRLCILGEHSDWMGEFRDVNPTVSYGMTVVCATNEGLYARCRGSTPGRLTFSFTLPDGKLETLDAPMDVAELTRMAAAGGFFSYVVGTAAAVITAHFPGGASSTYLEEQGIHINNYRTTLPMRKGLSSSAAVCVLVAKCFNEVRILFGPRFNQHKSCFPPHLPHAWSVGVRAGPGAEGFHGGGVPRRDAHAVPLRTHGSGQRRIFNPHHKSAPELIATRNPCLAHAPCTPVRGHGRGLRGPHDLRHRRLPGTHKTTPIIPFGYPPPHAHLSTPRTHASGSSHFPFRTYTAAGAGVPGAVALRGGGPARRQGHGGDLEGATGVLPLPRRLRAGASSAPRPRSEHTLWGE
jgi:GHMP kinases N terminal domain